MQHRLTTVARRNGGPFTRAQALHVGLSEAEIRQEVQSGRWQSLRRGVYAERHLLDIAARAPAHEHAIDVAAAILVLDRGDAVGSHHSAAQIHDWDMFPPSPQDVTLTRPPAGRGKASRHKGMRVLLAGLPPDHVNQRYGVLVTSAARTAVDLARALPFRDAVVMTDSALRQGVREEHLGQMLRDCAHWPGVADAARAIDFADCGAESVLESLARIMFAEQGLPAPQTQVWLDGVWPRVCVDFYWRQFRTVGEVDGLVKYTDPVALRNEKLRQERIEEAGYKMVRMTAHQITKQAGATATRLRRTFAR